MASDSQKVKLLCSFGGKILPRPSDGALRYAGGHTRIVSLRRSATLADIVAKISQVFGGPVSAVKYQLPDEDLDALISISSQEDLDNMMEEFDRVSENAADGSARMRIFLFSPADLADGGGEAAMDTGQSYIDAVNGIGLKRKDSLVSASSNEGASPSIQSPRHSSINQDMSRLGFWGDETLVSGRIEPQQVQFLNPGVTVVNVPAPQPYVHPIYYNAASAVSIEGNFKPVQQKMEHFVAFGDQLSAVEGNLVHNQPNQGKMGAFVKENLCRSDQNHSSNSGISSSSSSSNNNNNKNNNNSKGFHYQPLSQLPPLHPTHIQQLPSMYVPPLRPYPQQTLRLDDCQMCQKSLPHAHSDTLINDHTNGNGNGSGSSAVHEPKRVLQSHHSENPTKLQASLRPENVVEPIAEVAAVSAGQFSRQHENVEALDHPKALHPPGVIGVADPTRLQAPPRVDSEPSKVDTAPTGGQLGATQFPPEISHPNEKERLAQPNVETFDPTQVLHPQNAVSGGVLADSMGETKVDNMAASAQFGVYGFSQIPKITQLYDNERVLVNPNVPAVVGLPGDTQPSYTVTANPLQYRFPDPFQSLSHNMVPPHHLSKQDVTKQNVSFFKNGNFLAAEPPRRVSVPDISYDYVRPIYGVMDSFRMSAFEPSGITDQSRGAPAVNRGVPMAKPENSTLTVENNHMVRPQVGGNPVFRGNTCIMSGIIPEGNSAKPVNQLPPPSVDLKQEHPPLVADNTQVYRSQAGGNAIYLGNAFMSSGIVPEGNSTRPINEMPPSSLDFTRLQSLQPAETSQASTVMANLGPVFTYSQEMRVQPEVLNERLLVMPGYSGVITPSYNNNNNINVVPVGDRKEEASWFHPNDVLNNNMGAPVNGTIPVQYSNSAISNGHVEQFQGSSPPDSLFCNQDPRKMLGNMQMVPPMLNKVPSKEFVAPNGACTDNHSVNNKASDVSMLVEEGGFHHLQNSTNKDSCIEPVRFVQGEEHNKQEVQCLAEQVVTSVLQPSVPPAPIAFSHERKEADLPSNKESGLCEANALIQTATAVDDHEIEGIMTKQADKMNFGFPVTDDIGRLQIINNSDLEELRELGSGTFGTVYHGKWRGSDVAIKRINDRCFAGKPAEEERMRADFWNEACKLADLHHPNVVAFYGVVLDGPGGTFATVTEFMVNGSLRRALQKNDKSLDKRRRLLIAMDVAFGMEYLHGKNLIHFDLKSDNLLVNLRDPQRPICKVADLGLSKVKCQTLISGGVRGTLPWMAPELLNGGSSLVSEKVDVFSFGIVMWELLTGEEPYADLHYGAIIGGIVSNTLRPPVPESCDPEWRSLMEQCWSAEPSDRPNFTEIAGRLRSMAASLTHK